MSESQPQICTESSVHMAQRLRAHARLCRHIAAATWNEEIATKLMALAEDCTLAAERLEPVSASVPRSWHQASADADAHGARLS
jgi:hypothetical protein